MNVRLAMPGTWLPTMGIKPEGWSSKSGLVPIVLTPVPGRASLAFVLLGVPWRSRCFSSTGAKTASWVCVEKKY